MYRSVDEGFSWAIAAGQIDAPAGPVRASSRAGPLRLEAQVKPVGGMSLLTVLCRNAGPVRVTGWWASFSAANRLTGALNVDVRRTGGTRHRIVPDAWRAVVGPGETVTFALVLEGRVAGFHLVLGDVAAESEKIAPACDLPWPRREAIGA